MKRLSSTNVHILLCCELEPCIPLLCLWCQACWQLFSGHPVSVQLGRQWMIRILTMIIYCRRSRPGFRAHPGLQAGSHPIKWLQVRAYCSYLIWPTLLTLLTICVCYKPWKPIFGSMVKFLHGLNLTWLIENRQLKWMILNQMCSRYLSVSLKGHV